MMTFETLTDLLQDDSPARLIEETRDDELLDCSRSSSRQK